MRRDNFYRWFFIIVVILTILAAIVGSIFLLKEPDGGKKKAPIVAALESLRKDILQYSDRLCLNPRANIPAGKNLGKKAASPLAEALASIEI